MHIQKKLFTPIQIGPITLKHRVVMPPMSRLRAQWPTGIPSDLTSNITANVHLRAG